MLPKKNQWALLFAAAVVALVFTFQNCAQKGNGNFASSGTGPTIYSSGGNMDKMTIYEVLRIGAVGSDPRYDFMLTPVSSEGASAGYAAAGSSLQIYINPSASRAPLYRCVSTTHFFSTNLSCDGVPGASQDTPDGSAYILGYIELSPVGAANVPLYRCYHGLADRYRIANNATSCSSFNGFVTKDLLGYIEASTISAANQIP